MSMGAIEAQTAACYDVGTVMSTQIPGTRFTPPAPRPRNCICPQAKAL